MDTYPAGAPGFPTKVQHLPADEVHIWRVDRLDLGAEALRELAALLTAEEKARAARFAFPKDGDRFRLARSLLRLLLGHYLGAEPAALRIDYSKYGKPMLADVPFFHFNLSHAGDLILYAFACNRRVGIDVELIRSDVEIVSLARYIFSSHEQQAFFALPPDQRGTAFFDGWTRKEAYVKARGLGLSLPLPSFDVSLQPDEAALLQTRDDPDEAARWSLRALHVGAGYRAALAVEGNGWQLVINDS